MAHIAKLPQQIAKRSCHIAATSSRKLTNADVRKKRNALFTEEKKRQESLIPRIDKIEVQYKGAPEEATLLMNKDISTPFNVAQHLSQMLLDRSALALVNGQLWDMHRPLEEDCTVELMHFEGKDPFHLNRAFWRSCSFMLGASIEAVFKDDIFVELHSFPAPNVQSGSFVHDVDLKLSDWSPSKEELMVFSAYMHRMAEKAHNFERLTVDAKVAEDMFSDNQYKAKQIPSIAANSKSGSAVTLYRAGDHVDMSGGPMIANTGFLGRRCTVAAAHQVEHDSKTMYRFQGVALPKGIFLGHVPFGILEKRAMKLNLANIPGSRSVNPS